MTDPTPQEAAPEEDLLATVGENIGSAAGKIVAGAKRTAESLEPERAQLARVATKVRSQARTAIKKTEKKAKTASRPPKKAARSAKEGVGMADRPARRGDQNRNRHHVVLSWWTAGWLLFRQPCCSPGSRRSFFSARSASLRCLLAFPFLS